MLHYFQPCPWQHGERQQQTNYRHHVSRILSSVLLDSLVALQAAEGEVQLGVPVLVLVCAGWPGAFLPWRRVAAWHKESIRVGWWDGRSNVSSKVLETRMRKMWGIPVRLGVEDAGETYCMWEWNNGSGGPHDPTNWACSNVLCSGCPLLCERHDLFSKLLLQQVEH